jgi:hypothetical protein
MPYTAIPEIVFLTRRLRLSGIRLSRKPTATEIWERIKEYEKNKPPNSLVTLAYLVERSV